MIVRCVIKRNATFYSKVRSHSVTSLSRPISHYFTCLGVGSLCEHLELLMILKLLMLFIIKTSFSLIGLYETLTGDSGSKCNLFAKYYLEEGLIRAVGLNFFVSVLNANLYR